MGCWMRLGLRDVASVPGRRWPHSGIVGLPVFAAFVVILGTLGCRAHGSSSPCTWEDGSSESDCADPDPPSIALPLDCATGGGTCVDEPPDGFFGPNLYWIGPIESKPACPDEAPTPGATAYADLGPMAHSCPTCECGPSETTCIPSSDWTVAAAKCPGDGAALLSFDVLADPWDGTCNGDHAIKKGLLCEGGLPCAQSVTVKAPKASSAPCASHAVGTEKRDGPPWPWQTIAKECLITPSDTCTDEGEGKTCVPTPGDWLACISVDHGDHEGDDIDCPAFYPEKHLFYRDAKDTRECSACTCGAVREGECAVAASAYGDAVCTDIVGLVVLASTDEKACFDISTGTALASKLAEVKWTTPGTCHPAGGAPSGEVIPRQQMTLCCHHEVAN